MTEAERREREMLAQTEVHIADGERHVSDQMERVRRLRAGGHDASFAEEILATFVQMLEQHRIHRETILKRIAYLDDLG